MKHCFRNPFYLFLLLVFSACTKNDDELPVIDSSLFSGDPQTKTLSTMIGEISGIADSRTAPGYLWAHEDSGNPTQIYLISHNGNVGKRIFIEGVKNRDWEDMVRAGNQLFIADIGDNKEDNSSYTIYQIEEPSPATDTVASFQKIRFRYPDGSHNAEAFLIDPHTNDILIITKTENPSRIYKIAYPYQYTATDTAQYVGKIKFTGVVSAALSPTGTEAILKTYSGLFYYNNSNGESLEKILQQEPIKLPYQMEPQGEAICFAADNSGFYTLSEKGLSNSVRLYFYPRK